MRPKHTAHVYTELNRDVCHICGRTRKDIVDHNIIHCDGTPEFRAWLEEQGLLPNARSHG